jgi:hypothetical protein
MTMRARAAGMVAIALVALGHPAAAIGDHWALEDAQSGPKDYSRNSVTGEYAPPRESAAAEAARRRFEAAGHADSSSLARSYRRLGVGKIRTSSLAGTTSPLSANNPRPAETDDPWPELAIGFLAGCLVAAAAAVIAGRTRRARIAV